jgi:hypothetical protein
MTALKSAKSWSTEKMSGYEEAFRNLVDMKNCVSLADQIMA